MAYYKKCKWSMHSKLWWANYSRIQFAFGVH